MIRVRRTRRAFPVRRCKREPGANPGLARSGNWERIPPEPLGLTIWEGVVVVTRECEMPISPNTCPRIVHYSRESGEAFLLEDKERAFVPVFRIFLDWLSLFYTLFFEVPWRSVPSPSESPCCVDPVDSCLRLPLMSGECCYAQS